MWTELYFWDRVLQDSREILSDEVEEARLNVTGRYPVLLDLPWLVVSTEEDPGPGTAPQSALWVCVLNAEDRERP